MYVCKVSVITSLRVYVFGPSICPAGRHERSDRRNGSEKHEESVEVALCSALRDEERRKV